MKFSIDFVGDTAVEARLEGLPDALREALRRKVFGLTLMLEDYIKNDKLSGQVLNVVSGRLRRSIFSTTTETATSVEGTVASSGDVKYARIHEYGFSGPETVRAHSRTIKQAFGRAISPKTVFVKEFSREMHMPERSFMRSALADKREEIKQGLADAIHEGTR